MGERVKNTVTEDKKGENGNSTKNEEVISLSDSDSSYVIEEEIVEYEISDSEGEEKSMNTKNSSKVSNKKNGDKSDQSSLFETALKMKEEEIKNQEVVANIDNTNNELPNENDANTKPLKNADNNSNDDENNVSNSFKNVFDSMENIKTRLSNNQLYPGDTYRKISFDKPMKQFERDIKRLRHVVSRINATHNSLKKALYEMKGNPFSIPDDEPYSDLASECNTESVADVNVDYCEDDMFNIDEADVFEKYILCIDEKNREKFADHYENLYNVNELFKKTIFSSPVFDDIENNEQEATTEEVVAA